MKNYPNCSIVDELITTLLEDDSVKLDEIFSSDHMLHLEAVSDSFQSSISIHDFKNGFQMSYLEGTTNEDVTFIKENVFRDSSFAVFTGINASFTLDGLAKKRDVFENNKFIVHNARSKFQVHLRKNKSFQLLFIRTNSIIQETIAGVFNDVVTNLVTSKNTFFAEKKLNPEMVELLTQIKKTRIVTTSHMLYLTRIGIKGLEFLALVLHQLKVDGSGTILEDITEEELKIAINIRNEILDNLDISLSIKELTKLAGTNEYQAKITFKKIFKMPIHKYYRKKKLEKAYHLLTDTRESVSEIAMQVGYINIGHFCRNFKDEFGLTPKQHQLNIKS